MALTFALPPGASEPREPYVPEFPGETENPERDFRDWINLVGGVIRASSELALRDVVADRPIDPDILESIERAATALNTATAIYRARRNP